MLITDPDKTLRRCGSRLVTAVAFLCALAGPVSISHAQDAPGWEPGVQSPATPAPPAEPPVIGPGNTTVVPRTGGSTEASGDAVPVRLVAQLTADGQHIDQGLVWRVFDAHAQADGKAVLVATNRDASPVVKLKPGDYLVNVAFGRAHLTRRITAKAGASDPAVEPFVINAGGLRVMAQLGGEALPPNSVSYSIYSDRDQSDNRKLILSAAKPGLVIRLNAGIYNIVSTYGDANATVRSDVTVEAGKLTEATVSHSAAKATFKLVQRAGGEALPDTQWTIQTQQGDEIKHSVGALPTHILAPGTYTVIAKSQGKAFQRDFTVANGETAQVEVVMN